MVKKCSLRAIISMLLIASLMLLAGCGTSNTQAPASSAPKVSSAPAVASSAPATSQSAKQASKEMAISTAAAGGAWYPIGAAMADVLNNAGLGINARVQTTGGAVENVKLVHTGETEIGITISNIAYSGYNGTAPYPSKMSNIRGLFSGLSTGVLQITVLDNSPIKSIADLKGKKVAVGPAGGGALTALADLFNEYGFKFSDITASYISYDEGITMMTDKNVDAAVSYASLPTPAIKTLEAQKKGFRLLSIEDNIEKSLLGKYPYYVKVNIPKDMYGQPADVNTIGTNNIVIVNKDIPDDTVYKILTTFFDAKNLEKIRNSQPSAKLLNLEHAAELPIPLHPGAEKFFKEKGVIK